MLRALPILFLFASAAIASAQATKAPAPQAKQGTKAPVTKSADTKGQGTKTSGRPGLTVAPQAAARPQTPVMMREVYDFSAGGRRDPFFSLISTSELRPTVTDLVLAGIIYDESGRRSVALLRDIVTKEQYRVSPGMTLGRMRVALIKRKSVIFSIEEFGLNRQDSLVLGDTTKARAR